MPIRRPVAPAIVPALALAACGGPAEPDAGGAHAAPAAFAQCATCHAIETGRDGIGPSLAGVFGAPAGRVPGFAYSAALRDSGIVWDEAALDAYLEDPQARVPGTRMIYAGLSDPAARAEVIDYLKTL